MISCKYLQLLNDFCLRLKSIFDFKRRNYYSTTVTSDLYPGRFDFTVTFCLISIRLSIEKVPRLIRFKELTPNI